MTFSTATAQPCICVACAYLFPAGITTIEAQTNPSTGCKTSTFSQLRDTLSECYITPEDRVLLGYASHTWVWVSLDITQARSPLLTASRCGRHLLRLTTLEGVQGCLPSIIRGNMPSSRVACIFVSTPMATYLGLSIGKMSIVKLKPYCPHVPTPLLPSPFCNLPIACRCLLRVLHPSYSSRTAPSFEEWRQVLLDFFSVPRLLAQGQVIPLLPWRSRFARGVPTAMNRYPIPPSAQGYPLPSSGDVYFMSLWEIERGITHVMDYQYQCLSRTASQRDSPAEQCFWPAFSSNVATHSYRTVEPQKTCTDQHCNPSSSLATSSTNQHCPGADFRSDPRWQLGRSTCDAPTSEKTSGKQTPLGLAGQFKYSVARRQSNWSPRSDGNPRFVPPLTSATWQRRMCSFLLYVSVDRLDLLPEYTGCEAGEDVGVVYKGITNVFLERSAAEKCLLPFSSGVLCSQLYHHLRCATPKSPELYVKTLEAMLTDGGTSRRDILIPGVSSRRAILLKGYRGCGRRTLATLAGEKLGVNYCELDCYTISEKLERSTVGHEELRHIDGSVAPGGNSPFSACLVQAARTAAPAIIFIRHMGKLLGRLPRGRQRQAEMRIVNHLKWFLKNHRSSAERYTDVLESNIPSRVPCRDDVLVVGSVSDEEADPEGNGNPNCFPYSDLAGVFDSVMNIPTSDDVHRVEVIRATIEALEQQTSNQSETIATEISQTRPKGSGEDLRSLLWQAFHKHAEAQESTEDPRLSREHSFSPSDIKGVAKVPDVSFTSPAVYWEDVGGIEDVKSEIRDHVVLPLRCPHLFKGLRSGGGLLLFGPPGTGKTLLAKAVATDSSANFISVNGPEILNMYVGESEHNVRTLFKRANESAPCVLFFDELDALLPRRGRSSDSGGVIDRVVAQLLGEIDDLPHNVLFIGATNRIELIDKSALRPGRLDRCIYVGVQADRIPLLKTLTRGMTLEESSSSKHTCEQGEVSTLKILNKHIPREFTAADCKALCAAAGMVVLKKKVRFLRQISSALGMPPRAVLEVMKDYEQCLNYSDISRRTHETNFESVNCLTLNSVDVEAWLSEFTQSPLRLKLLYDATSAKTTYSSHSSYDVQLWLSDFVESYVVACPHTAAGGMKLWCLSTLPKGWLRACRELASTVQEECAAPSLLLEFSTPIDENSDRKRAGTGTTYTQSVELPQATLAGRRAFLWIQVPTGELPRMEQNTHRDDLYLRKLSACPPQHLKIAGTACWTGNCSTQKKFESNKIASEKEAIVQYIMKNVEYSEWSVYEVLQSKVTLQDFLYALNCTRQSLTKEEFRRYEKSRLAYSRR